MKRQLLTKLTPIKKNRKKLRCPECSKSITDWYLPQHINKKHRTAKKTQAQNSTVENVVAVQNKYECPECAKPFEKPTRLAWHLKLAHNNRQDQQEDIEEGLENTEPIDENELAPIIEENKVNPDNNSESGDEIAEYDLEAAYESEDEIIEEKTGRIF